MQTPFSFSIYHFFSIISIFFFTSGTSGLPG
jgi:hypothetical protein